MAKFLTQKAKINISVEIHPSAESAYQFFHSQPFLFNKNNFSFSALEALYQGQIYSVVSAGESKFLLIGGFEIIGLSINQVNFKNQKILVYDDMTEYAIEMFAWKSALRVLLSSVNRRQFGDVRRSLNDKAPQHIIKSIFSSKLTLAKFSELAPISVAGLKKQKTKNKIKKQETTTSETHIKPTIFEQLVKEANDGS
jgi:hypothetical protein|nr:hypothetical protein [uncultured Tolumonas sp.]